MSTGWVGVLSARPFLFSTAYPPAYPQLIHALILLPAYDDLMERTDGNRRTFDVIPYGDHWEIRGPDGLILSSRFSEISALQFAKARAAENQPATVRLLTMHRLITQEWDYPPLASLAGPYFG